jgi:hypothetical protein
MSRKTLYDSLFGPLSWEVADCVWTCAAKADRFLGFGGGLPSRDNVEDDAVDSKVLKGMLSPRAVIDMLMERDEFRRTFSDLPPQRREEFSEALARLGEPPGIVPDQLAGPDRPFARGAFKVTIVAPGRMPPAAKQRDAWMRFADDAALLDAMMGRLVNVYQRQRPARLGWWNRMYGDSPDAALPDVSAPGALKELIRPIEFRVHTDGEIGIHFTCAWDDCDGFGVLVRGGQVVAIGGKETALAPPDAREPVEDPVFGPLHPDGPEWYGAIRLEAFSAFWNVFADRLRFRRSRIQNLSRSAPPWDLIEGRFDLLVSVTGETPTLSQADAFATFAEDRDRSARLVLDSVVDYCRRVSPNYRKYFQGPWREPDHVANRARLTDSLGERITFHQMLVHAPTDPGRSVALGLSFACCWDEENGLGVRWRDGRVEEVGPARVALS